MGLINYIKDNWNNNRYLFVLDNISMFSGIFSATYISLIFGKTNFSPYAWRIIYFSYIINSITGIIYSIKRKTIPLLVLNLGYSTANLIGFYRAFLG